MYANYTLDSKGNVTGGTTTGGMRVMFASKEDKIKGQNAYNQAQQEAQQKKTAQGLTPQQLQEKIEALEKKLQDVTDELHRFEKQSITVVGNYDGTNLPVRANGVRRKIATAAP